MEWYKDLYVSDAARRHVRRTIRRINERKITADVFLLTYPLNKNNVMDIVPAAMLLQHAARRRCPKIIGIARGRYDAYELMEAILMETYENTGNFRVEDYLENR